MATLNRLAPGRVFLGLGTGNTAMRAMGQKPMRMAAFAEYTRVLAALLRGETVEYTHQGVAKPIRLLMHGEKYMRLDPPIPLYVSGFGPRAMGLAGEHADGLIFVVPPRGVAVPDALGHVRQGASRVGRNMDGFRNCAMINLGILEPGERVDSDRIKAALGPNVMASVYYFYDAWQERGIAPPPFLTRIWERYCALVEKTPAEHQHFRTHEYHYTRLHEGEADLIDTQLLRDTCLIGTPDELVEHIRALERDGLQELIFAMGTDAKWRLAEDFARLVMGRV